MGNPKFGGNRKAGEKATETDAVTGKPARSQEADRFLQHAIELLAPGGYLGMLMPKSFTISEASTGARKRLLEQCDVLEIWDLPDEIFKGQATVRPTVLFAQKRAKSGQPLNYPVRTRIAQGYTFELTGGFSTSSIAPSQRDWGAESKKARRSEAKVTHMMTYTTILSKAKWDRIRNNCRDLVEVAEITSGAISGSKRPWADYVSPKWVPWLSGVKKVIPCPFCIEYGFERIRYPNDLERPRKNRRYPSQDKEHLLAAPKVLLVSDPDPSWGMRAKVAIERRGYYVSDSFWAFVPKQEQLSLEVLAAIVSWDVSNAWIVDSLKYPKIQRRIIDTIPVPNLSDQDCERIEQAIRGIEAAAQVEALAPEAQAVIDQILKRAYHLDDDTFQTLRRIMEWDKRPQETERPLPPDPQAIIAVGGQVEKVSVVEETITLWFDGILGTPVLPITDNMPGWMLREGAAFTAQVSYEALQNEEWHKLEWWNIRPKRFTYLTEEELLGRLETELAPIMKE